MRTKWLTPFYRKSNKRTTIVMTEKNLKEKLYKKVVELIPVLETANPKDCFSIGKDGEGAKIFVQGFNSKPEDEITIDLSKRITPQVEKKPNGTYKIIKEGYNHAPTIWFNFNKKTKEVQVSSIWDDRPEKEYAQCLETTDKTGNKIAIKVERELNQKLNEYIDEFINLGYKLK